MGFMSALCRPITFRNISRLKFKAIRARITAQSDVVSDGDTGTATGYGCKAEWAYNEAEQALTIHCTEKPRMIPEDVIEGKIRSLVESVNA